ncbi:hypothetical protein AB835_01525 [Candidatus Endobugula sertula]|uniref:Resolvase/invertase-type recombinase catalytic domain-containing protein n=1 Tax=Candidatus Endobugula sertula TaxID=62101 RepID=A0A1D2QT44_9GAMM|nr:hypothetical protein AB835_01525 [Candidatus Endobugula sertula]
MTTQAELKKAYQAYMKMYGSMLQDLADSEETIQNMIHGNEDDIGLILSAVRCTIEQTLDDNYVVKTEGCPVMPLDHSTQKAVIYCRSALHLQEKDNAVDSQKQRCQDFAKSKGYTVTDCFYDYGVSGISMDRPSLQKMLAFLETNKAENYIVLVDDVSRLARNFETHLRIREAISELGAKLESPTMTFDDSPTNQCTENLLAAMAGYLPEQGEEEYSA